MKKNPFKPEYFVKPNLEKEMHDMHMNSYVAQMDSEGAELEEGNEATELYSKEDQEIFEEMKRGSFVRMNELTTLSPEIAKILSEKTDFINLPGLTFLTASAAEFLGSCRGRLFLTGLTQLEPGVAEALGRHEGFLDLGRLQTLSVSDARALNKQKGDMRLSDLQLSFQEPYTSESNEIMRIFSTHIGEILFSPEIQKKYELYKKEHEQYKKVI